MPQPGPAYHSALEPPDQPGAGAPTMVPGQPGSQPTPGFAAGSAPLPAPHDPWQQPPPAPPARRGRGPTIGLVIMSVVAVLLLGLGGVLGYLWLSTDNELTETRDQLTAEVAQLSDTLADRDGEIDRLDEELEGVRDDLSDAETRLEGTENMVELLEDQQDTIRQCILLLGQANAAFEDGDDSLGNDLLDEAEDFCQEADEILGF